MRIFIPPSFMTRSVEEEKTEDVNVPETVDPGEEPWCILESRSKILVPLVGSLRHLTDDEPDDGECRGEKGGQHQEFESPDYPLQIEENRN